MEKYYIEEKSFFQEQKGQDIWNFLMAMIAEKGNEIAIVLPAGDSLEINDPVLRNPGEFKNLKPIRTLITLRPFLVKNENLHVCHHYPLRQEILQEMGNEWLERVRELSIMPCFFKILDEQGRLVLAMAPQVSIGLLHPKEAEALTQMGMELKEWKILLNDAI